MNAAPILTSIHFIITSLCCVTVVLGFVASPQIIINRSRNAVVVVPVNTSPLLRQHFPLLLYQTTPLDSLPQQQQQQRDDIVIQIHETGENPKQFSYTATTTTTTTTTAEAVTSQNCSYTCQATLKAPCIHAESKETFLIRLHATNTGGGYHDDSTTNEYYILDHIIAVFHTVLLNYLKLEQLAYREERDGTMNPLHDEVIVRIPQLSVDSQSTSLDTTTTTTTTTWDKSLLLRLAEIGFVGEEDDDDTTITNNTVSDNLVGLHLESYLPFLNEYILRHRGTNQGNVALNVQRMLCQRRVPYDFSSNKVSNDTSTTTVALYKDALPYTAIDEAVTIVDEIKSKRMLSTNPDSVDGLPSLHLNLVSNGKLMFDDTTTAESEFGRMISKLTNVLQPYLYDEVLPEVQTLLKSNNLEISDVFLRNYGCDNEDESLQPTRYSLSAHYDITAVATCVIILDSTASTGKNGLYTIPTLSGNGRSSSSSSNNAALRKFFPLNKGDGVVHTFDVLHGVDVDPELNKSRTSLILWFRDNKDKSTRQSWLDGRTDDISQFVSGMVFEEDDVSKAIGMYVSSASQGNIFAMTALAQLCSEDQVSVSEYERIKGLIPTNIFHPKEDSGMSCRDLANPLWYHAAIFGGNPVAQYSLARSLMQRYAITESGLSAEEQEQQLLLSSVLFTMAHNNHHQDSLEALNMMMKTECQRLYEMGVEIPSEEFFASPVIRVLQLSFDRNDPS